MLYVPSASALSNFTARENPANITASSGQVDYKTLSVMADMYIGLDKIGIDLNQTNFTAAGIDYRAFKALYDGNKDVIRRLYDSDSDALDAINATNLTVDDIQAYLSAAGDYDKTYRAYENFSAMGDGANETASSVELRADYSRLSDAYKALQSSSYTSMDMLDNSNRPGINASLLKPFMDASDGLMSQMVKQNNMIRIASGQYSLTLSSESKQARIGDTVVYTAMLKNADGSPVQGANIVLYGDGVQYASGIAGVSGECELAYLVPDSLERDRVNIYAEYLPPGQPELPAVSDTVYLDIQDEATSLSLALASDSAAYGDSVNVSGRLIADRGFPARDQPVDIFIDGVHLGEATTGEDGVYALSFPIAENMPGGDCNITASYGQVPGDIFLGSSTPARMLNVIPGQTSITLFIPEDNFTTGGMASMSGRLVSGSGLNVSGAKVLAYMDSSGIGEGLTDSYGRYAIQAKIPYDSIPGNHSIDTVYVPSGGALAGSSSGKYAVHVDVIRPVISVNGTTLVLFSNDTLNVTGSLHTSSGIPVVGQAVVVRVSDTIGGTVTTDQSGDFYFSRTINGFDPAGYYGISVILQSPADLEPASAGHVLIVPADKAVAITAFAAMLALLFMVILLANAGMSIDKLAKLATGRLRLEADIGEEAASERSPPEPNVDVPRKAIPQQIPENISEQIGAGGFVEAATGMYVTAKAMAADHGVRVGESDTHREFYRAAIRSYPLLDASLRLVVDTYERMRYGHKDASAADMQNAFQGLRSVQAAFDKDAVEDKK